MSVVIPESAAGQRLDRALASLPEAAENALSRSRIASLIDAGQVTFGGQPVARNRKVTTGEHYVIDLPEPDAPEPVAEAIPLDIVYEDADLVVVNKPPGMVVHPAPGTASGTLVNALLAHCGDSLSGVGGTRRPGIVHRIDKDTSGLLVVAKNDRAHAGLSAQFAVHAIDRRYAAGVWGVPDRGDPRLAGLQTVSFDGGWIRIETAIGRHPNDRKRMAVVKSGGRNAITLLRAVETFAPGGPPFASLIECRLETGRTHQIRVHAAHIGHPLIGDPVYGRARTAGGKHIGDETRAALANFPRQALHAMHLGFDHPISGKKLDFHADLPQDMENLMTSLRRNS